MNIIASLDTSSFKAYCKPEFTDCCIEKDGQSITLTGEETTNLIKTLTNRGGRVDLKDKIILFYSDTRCGEK